MAYEGMTPEGAALHLMEMVGIGEGIDLVGDNAERSRPTRAWIFETYAECLKVAKGGIVGSIAEASVNPAG